jgi:ubiquitin-activating enzyme E1 C
MLLPKIPWYVDDTDRSRREGFGSGRRALGAARACRSRISLWLVENRKQELDASAREQAAASSAHQSAAAKSTVDVAGAAIHEEPPAPRRATLLTLLRRASPFANETGPLPCGEFEPLATTNDGSAMTENSRAASSGYYEASDALSTSKVLVVGAGGLGCEVLKNLALSGVRDVDVIDLDTIDVTNLNRQFLFRQEDVGSSKAETAAAFVNRRCPWMCVTPHHGRIQDKPPSFYAQFRCIISGLDNIEARRWLNATVVGLVETDDDGDVIPETVVPIVDGGTEGFSGQARLILPRITSCFECTIESFPPQNTFPLCTIAETPRRPEHCVAYAYVLQWPKEFPDRKLDRDSPDDMRWVHERARERAEKFGIDGVTYALTLGVVKNIIPAVASTNAVIAAACANECVKYLTYCSQSLNSYMMYMGSSGVHSHTFCYQPKEDCVVCAQKTLRWHVPRHASLNEFIQSRLKDPSSTLRLTSPSVVSSGGRTLYMPNPPALERSTRPNLDRPLSSLIGDGDVLTVTDPLLESISLAIEVRFEE